MTRNFLRLGDPFKTILGYVLASLILSLALIVPVLLIRCILPILYDLDLVPKVFLLCLSISVAYIVFGIALLCIIVLFKRALSLKSNLKDCNLTDFEYKKFETYTGLLGLAQYFFLHLTRGTFLIKMFYRGMGAKIGRNTLINTSKIFDCNLIEIGDNCIVGGDAIINGHIFENGLLKRRKVIIGNNVVIGTCSMILPGVIIEDNVTIGAHCLVPKNKILESNATYVGIPARKIGDKIAGSEIEEVRVSDSKHQLDKLKTDIKYSDVMLKLYDRLSVEIVAFETLMANVFLSSTGILFTLIIYGVINKPQVLLIIPPLIGVVSAFIVSTSASMLRAAFKKSEIEIFFQAAGAKLFNWETRFGELGKSRLKDLDGILIFVIYAVMWIIGIVFSFNGSLLKQSELFLNYPIYKILAFVNGTILIWVIICLIFSISRAKSYKEDLKSLKNELTKID